MIKGQGIDIDAAIGEAKILQKARHENVVQFFTIENRQKLFCIALELCDSTLEEHILKLRNTCVPLEKKKILQQATTGLEYLHQCKIIHGDLKPSNILFAVSRTNRWFVKISDFGASKQIADDRSGITLKSSHVGTLSWSAPEVLRHFSDPHHLHNIGSLVNQPE